MPIQVSILKVPRPNRTRMENSVVARKCSTKEVLRKLSHVLEEKNDDGVWERRSILKNTEELCEKPGGQLRTRRCIVP